MLIDLSNVEDHINPHFLPLLYDTNRYLIMRGSAGSGKSWFAGIKLLLRILMDYDTTKHRFLVLRKTLPSAKDSTYTLLNNYIQNWGMSPLIKSITVNPVCFTFDNGSEILIRGLDDPEKIKSIEGITSIWLEEASQFTQEDFDELDRRLRGNVGTYKQIMVTFNPISKYNWTYKTFFGGKKKNTTLHHSTFKDNTYIQNDKEYLDVLEQYKHSKNNYNYQVYYLGEFGVKEGLIYTNWEPISKFPVCDATCFGLDYGFSDSTAISRIGRRNEEPDNLYVELLLYKSGITNNDLITWCKNKLPKDALIFADSSEPDRIVDARRQGLNIKPAIKGPGSINAGIDFLQSLKMCLLQNDLYHYLEAEITSYSYDTNKHGESLERPSNKTPEHALDSIRYAAYTRFKRQAQYTNLIV